MPRKGSSAGRSAQGHFDNTALFEFSRVVNASLELPFILNHVLLTIMGKILSTRGMVVLARGDGHCRVEMVKGFPPGLLHREFDVHRVPVDLVDPKAVHARSHPWIKFFRDAEVATLLPLFSGNTLVGFLGFGESAGRRQLREQEFTYLRSIANLSATAIERVRVVAELQLVNRRLDGKIQELNTLLELGKEFGAVLDPEKLVRLLVFVLLGHTGTGRYLICAKEGADMRVLAQRIDGPPPQGELLAGMLHVKDPLSGRRYGRRSGPGSASIADEARTAGRRADGPAGPDPRADPARRQDWTGSRSPRGIWSWSLPSGISPPSPWRMPGCSRRPSRSSGWRTSWSWPGRSRRDSCPACFPSIRGVSNRGDEHLLQTGRRGLLRRHRRSRTNGT